MLMPLSQWYCDVCDQIIKKPEDGYVVWKCDKDLLNSDFRIVHQSRCDYRRDIYISSMPLKSFLGHDGRSYLLSFLSLGPVKFNISRESCASAKDLDQFVDFFRRVQVPYYEEARRKFASSNLLHDFSDANEFSPYTAEALRQIIQTY